MLLSLEGEWLKVLDDLLPHKLSEWGKVQAALGGASEGTPIKRDLVKTLRRDGGEEKSG